MNVRRRELKKDVNEIKEGGREEQIFSYLSVFQADIMPSSELYKNLVRHPLYCSPISSIAVFLPYLYSQLYYPKGKGCVILDSQCLAECLAVNKK